MSKTKNQVIDQMNENNTPVNNRQTDVNRMTMETLSELSTAVFHAMKEVQGDRTTGEAVCQSEVYCDLYGLSALGFDRFRATELRKTQYRNHTLHDLLKELYQRMKMFHHYAVAKGVDLPGIKWTEESGIFVIHLRDCALNMEHSLTDESRLPGWDDSITRLEGRLYAIGYDPDIDPDDPHGDCYQHYEAALNFLCELNIHDEDNTEHRDVTLCHHSWWHRDLLRDTLAQLDVIADMGNEQAEKKD